MPCSSSATISPSRIACLAVNCFGSFASSEYWGVISIWFRETSRMFPPSRKQTDRNPSHLVSKIHSGSEKGSSTSVASIGRIIVGIGAFRAREQNPSEDFGLLLTIRFLDGMIQLIDAICVLV